MTDTKDIQRVNWDVTIAQSEGGVSFFDNMIVRTLLGVNVFFCLVSFGLLGYFIRPTENIIVLHYNVYFGVDIQGIWWQVFILPIAGLFFLGGHTFFARRFYDRSLRIASYLMLFSSGLLSIGIVLASASVAYINY
ncbi:MAG: hypothetical protein COZ29_02150 [Candidatus Moranbacteria bacterium CG_4_10_14_3_um_filter_45_9]|nr:MAG: hypothetical protein AUK19_01385 [Candidatus Moranbacteria bacterium CG2_30_45_14]PIX90022.1 MAG: hypothetical protein COZ29_02150 [Candidatus Moranbacteria bacterium CG_4_10_14_3_um_filter_45_9]PJA85284.1 MAG: hypothetical protein CO143_01970 [Candidatus Moranbacteria bacterium CG_4_9_14_3_um_filter_45_14]